MSQAAPPPILSDPNPGFARWALHAVYDLAWAFVALVASPWWVYRCARSKRFRAMVWARLGLDLPDLRSPKRPRVLVHGVSVGEIKGAQALVRELERARPDVDVVVCTTTDTGLDVARRLYPRHTVVRFPLDHSWCVRRFLRRVDPSCVVLVELEIWPNFLRESNRAGVPLAVVNGRITETSFDHYRWFKHLLPQFNRLSLLCVQDADYARRFEELQAARERILVTGNIKVDGLPIGARAPSAELARLLGPRRGQLVIAAGSTHHPEERLVTTAWLASARTTRLILVPRHPERAASVERDLSELGLHPQLLTRLRAGEASDPDRPAIVDTIGELESVWSLCDLAFVGGSLIPHGGQNMLEPASQGKAAVYGPNVGNFLQEAALLERAGAALRLASADELAPTFERLLASREDRARMGAAGLSAVEAQKGATAVTLDALFRRVLAHGAPGPLAAVRI